MITLLSVYILLFIIQFSLTQSKTELKFVYEVFRHGARSPWAPGNKGINETSQDIFGEYWFNSLPGLESELTGMGLRQQYLLGYKMRSRYVDTGFLDKSFNMSQVLIYSTNVNRTMMSAQSQLFGMYPPGTGNQIFDNQSILAIPPGNPIPDLDKILTELQNNSILFGSQVFPVHLFDEKYEGLHNTGKCPAISNILNNNEKKQEIVEYQKTFNATYFDKLQSVLGFKDKDYLMSMHNLFLIADAFIASYFEGRNLESLVKAGINLDDFYKETHTIERLWMVRLFGDKDCHVSKLSATGVLKELINNLDWVVAQENLGDKADWTKRQKFIMHSMHDTSIFGILTYLDFTIQTGNKDYPEFASSLIFEFTKNTTKTKNYNFEDFTVSIEINNKNIYNSQYENFRTKINSQLLTKEEIDDFCDLISHETHILFIIIIVVLAIVVIIQIIVIIIVVRKRQNLAAYSENLTS